MNSYPYLEAIMAGVTEQSLTTLLSQLTYSPYYILIVIFSIAALFFLRNDKGFSTAMYRIIAALYIFIYLLAVYLYISKG